jgi:HK97 family phage portal protein
MVRKSIRIFEGDISTMAETKPTFAARVIGLFRASPNNPSTSLAKPAEWLFSDDRSKTGVAVNEKSAMTFSAVWASVRILSETIASLPWNVYTSEDESPMVVPNHPITKVLRRPNAMMTSMTFRETMMANLALHGNAFAFIERDGAARVTQMIPVHPLRVEIKVVQNEKFYHVDKKEVYSDFEMIHVCGLSFDGVMGISPIKAARETFGIGLAANQFGAQFFGNGANVGGVLTHPGRLSDEAYTRIKNSWANSYGGLGNAHKTAILEEGMKIERMTIPPDQAQFLQTRVFQVEEVARWFLIPPHMIGDLKNSATRANVEEQGIQFVRNTIRPYAVRWEEEFTLKLFGSESAFFVQFNLEGLLRGDIKSRYDAYAVGRQWGWLSVNDIRKKEQLPDVDGGDIYLQPLNMVNVGEDESI